MVNYQIKRIKTYKTCFDNIIILSVELLHLMDVFKPEISVILNKMFHHFYA